ncbi:hypothetical protein ACQ4PT_027937 [Festuca glaucescens]
MLPWVMGSATDGAAGDGRRCCGAADGDADIRVWQRYQRRAMVLQPVAGDATIGGGQRVLARPSLDGAGAGTVVLQRAEGGAASSWAVVLQGGVAELPAGVDMALVAAGGARWGAAAGRSRALVVGERDEEEGNGEEDEPVWTTDMVILFFNRGKRTRVRLSIRRRRRRWSDDLPPDALREIVGHLHVAADFVSFHAVCKPWRDSRDPLSRTTTTANQFLPWLLSSAGKHYLPQKMRCVFSKSSYRAPSPLQYAAKRSWVASADGAALRGIVYGDGTTLLYTTSSVLATTIRFRAALLRPGDTQWTFVDRSIETLGRQGELCVAYHGGRILVTAQSSLWRVIMPGGGCDVLVPRPWMPGEHAGCSALFSYVLESQGELLWASVQVRWRYTDRFAVDASLLSGNGGCAYFVYYNKKTTMRPLEQFGVYRCNLVDGKTELIERLPQERWSTEWDNGKCTWFVPQPTISPIEELIERKLEAQKLLKQQQKAASVTSSSTIIDIKRHYESLASEC